MRDNSFMEPLSCRIMMPSSILQSPSTADLFMSPLTAPRSTSQKKYLVCCLICGCFSCLLGAMFLGVYYLIRSYTLNGYFETVPTYVPATMLIMTGLCIVSFSKRKNRYSCMIYFTGISSAVSALTCAAVTITTKILHMSRLQDLNLNCEYKITTRICTCYSEYENRQEEGRKFLFDAVADCRVAQGDLYSCLQAIFGLSIAGVLVAVFSCMLSYLLFSHERKKMYWEQLDMRCRLLHASNFAGQAAIHHSHHHQHCNHHHQQQHQQQHQHHHHHHHQNHNDNYNTQYQQTSTLNHHRDNNGGDSCGCCEHCHNSATTAASSGVGYPYPPQQILSSGYPWLDNYGVDESKFLTIGAFAVGNNDGINGVGSAIGGVSGCGNTNTYRNNFYGPNLNRINNSDNDSVAQQQQQQQQQTNICNNNSSGSSWRWPRMPWQRNNNLDFNLFHYPFTRNTNDDFYHNWNGYLGSSHCIGGYPIGMWGPPPPPYTDPIINIPPPPEFSTTIIDNNNSDDTTITENEPTNLNENCQSIGNVICADENDEENVALSLSSVSHQHEQQSKPENCSESIKATALSIPVNSDK